MRNAIDSLQSEHKRIIKFRLIEELLEKETKITGGVPGVITDSFMAIGGTLLKDKHPFFDALGKSGKTKLLEDQQIISHLKMRLDEAVKNLDSMQQGQLLKTGNILGKQGLDKALDYIIMCKIQNPP